MEHKNIANQIVRESITEALLKLMKKKDFSDISISELTKTAGVGRVSFYRNYDSKEDILIQHMTEEVSNKWNSQILDIPQTHTKQIWEAAFSLFEPLLPTIILLKKSHITSIFYEFLVKLLNNPEENESIADSYRRAATIGIFFSVYDQWIKSDMKETPEELSQMFKNVNLQSIQ